MSCSNQKKRQRKEVEWVDFEIIKTDNREEMVDDSVVERSVGVYSRFHLAANEGRVTQTGYRLLLRLLIGTILITARAYPFILRPTSRLKASMNSSRTTQGIQRYNRHIYLFRNYAN